MTGRDVASLVLRAAIGGTMVAHGIRHERTLAGTAGWFGSIGFKQPRLQATASAVVEVGAGAALIAGAMTPLAASAVVGTMAVAARSVHLENGFFITAEGYEYVLNLSAASIALAAIGPGSLSVDRLLGIHDRLTPCSAPGSPSASVWPPRPRSWLRSGNAPSRSRFRPRSPPRRRKLGNRPWPEPGTGCGA